MGDHFHGGGLDGWKGGVNEVQVEFLDDAGVARLVEHVGELTSLELVEGPAKGVWDDGLVPVEADVLVAGAVVVVGAAVEAVEGEELDFLAGNVAEDVDGEALSDGEMAEFQAELDVAHFEDAVAAVVGDGTSLGECHLAGGGFDFVELTLDLVGVSLGSEVFGAGLGEHGAEVAAKLAHGPADGVAGGGLVEVVTFVDGGGSVVVVGGLVEAVEAEKFRLLALHGAHNHEANALVVEQVSVPHIELDVTCFDGNGTALGGAVHCGHLLCVGFCHIFPPYCVFCVVAD